ncbi:hypothetical protein FB451DRAFT_1268674 [Mycena latifolia]|nr:hypothetical protein FB451DRAFT_1268674 [Mycena latifolia]
MTGEIFGTSATLAKIAESSLGVFFAYLTISEVVGRWTALVMVLCGLAVIAPSLVSTRVRRRVFSVLGLRMLAIMIVWLLLWVPCVMAFSDWTEKLEEHLDLQGFPEWLVAFIILTILISAPSMLCLGLCFVLLVTYMLVRCLGPVLPRRSRQNSLV